MHKINGIHAIFLLATATTEQEFIVAHEALARAHTHGFTDPTTNQPADLDQYGTVISAYADWAAETCGDENKFRMGTSALVNMTSRRPQFIDSVMAGLSHAPISIRGLGRARIKRAILDLASEKDKLGPKSNISMQSNIMC